MDAKEAWLKGYDDYMKCGGLTDPNRVTEFSQPSWDPPEGFEDEYRDGWKAAKRAGPGR